MAAKFSPYDLILESVGGNSLGAAMKMIAPGGMCVLYGVSASSEATFDLATFMRTGGASLYGFIVFHLFHLFHEIPHRPARIIRNARCMRRCACRKSCAATLRRWLRMAECPSKRASV